MAATPVAASRVEDESAVGSISAGSYAEDSRSLRSVAALSVDESCGATSKAGGACHVMRVPSRSARSSSVVLSSALF